MSNPTNELEETLNSSGSVAGSQQNAGPSASTSSSSTSPDPEPQPSTSKEGMSDDEEILKMFRSIDSKLEDKARKNNLSVVNVKSILHHLIKNPQTISMFMGLRAEDVPDVKLTRSRARAAAADCTEPQPLSLMDLRPVSITSKSFLNVDYTANSDEDSDYTDVDDEHASDGESSVDQDESLSSPPKKKREEGECSTDDDTREAAVVEDPDKTLTEDAQREDSIDKQLAMSPSPSGSVPPPTPAHLRRSRRTLNDSAVFDCLQEEHNELFANAHEQEVYTYVDDDYLNFLQQAPSDAWADGADSEDGDSEYNVLDDMDADTRDRDELTFGRDAEIPMREVEDLFLDLVGEDGLPQLLPQLPAGLVDQQRKKRHNYPRPSARRALASSPDAPPNIPFDPSASLISGKPPVFTAGELKQLMIQLEMHTQLATQFVIGCHNEPRLQHVKNAAQLMINELDAAFFSSPLGPRSLFNISNMPGAIRSCHDVIQLGRLAQSHLRDQPHSVVPPRSETIVCVSRSEAIRFPQLLPSRSLQAWPLVHPAFTASEEMLLMLGLVQFCHIPHSTHSNPFGKYHMICQHLLPNKTSYQLKNHIKNIRMKPPDHFLNKILSSAWAGECVLQFPSIPSPLPAGLSPHQWPAEMLPHWYKVFWSTHRMFDVVSADGSVREELGRMAVVPPPTMRRVRETSRAGSAAATPERAPSPAVCGPSPIGIGHAQLVDSGKVDTAGSMATRVGAVSVAPPATDAAGSVEKEKAEKKEEEGKKMRRQSTATAPTDKPVEKKARSSAAAKKEKENTTPDAKGKGMRKKSAVGEEDDVKKKKKTARVEKSKKVAKEAEPVEQKKEKEQRRKRRSEDSSTPTEDQPRRRSARIESRAQSRADSRNGGAGGATPNILSLLASPSSVVAGTPMSVDTVIVDVVGYTPSVKGGERTRDGLEELDREAEEEERERADSSRGKGTRLDFSHMADEPPRAEQGMDAEQEAAVRSLLLDFSHLDSHSTGLATPTRSPSRADTRGSVPVIPSTPTPTPRSPQIHTPTLMSPIRRSVSPAMDEHPRTPRMDGGTTTHSPTLLRSAVISKLVEKAARATRKITDSMPTSFAHFDAEEEMSRQSTSHAPLDTPLPKTPGRSIEREEEEEGTVPVSIDDDCSRMTGGAGASATKCAADNVKPTPAAAAGVKKRAKRPTREERERIGADGMRNPDTRRRLYTLLARRMADDVRQRLFMHNDACRGVREAMRAGGGGGGKDGQLWRRLSSVLLPTHRDVYCLLAALSGEGGGEGVDERTNKTINDYKTALDMIVNVEAYCSHARVKPTGRSILKMIQQTASEGAPMPEFCERMRVLMEGEKPLWRAVKQHLNHLPFICDAADADFEFVDLTRPAIETERGGGGGGGDDTRPAEDECVDDIDAVIGPAEPAAKARDTRDQLVLDGDQLFAPVNGQMVPVRAMCVDKTRERDRDREESTPEREWSRDEDMQLLETYSKFEGRCAEVVDMVSSRISASRPEIETRLQFLLSLFN